MRLQQFDFRSRFIHFAVDGESGEAEDGESGEAEQSVDDIIASIFATAQMGAAMTDKARNESERISYFTDNYNNPDVQCFSLDKGIPLVANIDIPSGWYEMRYMGDEKATVEINYGLSNSSGSNPIATFEWSADAGTIYDIQKCQLLAGSKVSLTDCGNGGDSSEWVLLVLTEEIPLN